MRAGGSSKPTSIPIACLLEAAGVFTWNIETNTLYADPVVATLFGLEAEDAQAGLPVQSYLDRIHPEDRPRVAGAIHAAIVSGQPYQAEYRLVQLDGTLLWVIAMGQCFRNRAGNPSEYAGVVWDVTNLKAQAEDGMVDQCHKALEVARSLGNLRVVELLTEAISELEDNRRVASLSMGLRH